MIDIMDRDQFVEDVEEMVIDLIEYEICKGVKFDEEIHVHKTFLHKRLCEMNGGRMKRWVVRKVARMENIPWSNLKTLVAEAREFLGVFAFLKAVFGLVEDTSEMSEALVCCMQAIDDDGLTLVRTTVNLYYFEEHHGNKTRADANLTSLGVKLLDSFSDHELIRFEKWLGEVKFDGVWTMCFVEQLHNVVLDRLWKKMGI